MEWWNFENRQLRDTSFVWCLQNFLFFRLLCPHSDPAGTFQASMALLPLQGSLSCLLPNQQGIMLRLRLRSSGSKSTMSLLDNNTLPFTCYLWMCLTVPVVLHDQWWDKRNQIHSTKTLILEGTSEVLQK